MFYASAAIVIVLSLLFPCFASIKILVLRFLPEGYCFAGILLFVALYPTPSRIPGSYSRFLDYLLFATSTTLVKRIRDLDLCNLSSTKHFELSKNLQSLFISLFSRGVRVNNYLSGEFFHRTNYKLWSIEVLYW